MKHITDHQYKQLHSVFLDAFGDKSDISEYPKISDEDLKSN